MTHSSFSRAATLSQFAPLFVYTAALFAITGWLIFLLFSVLLFIFILLLAVIAIKED